jgi:hypothetical protein
MLHDLLAFVCQQELVPSFAALRLGPPLRHPLLRQLFSPPLDLAEVPAIGAGQVLEALRAVLLQNLNVRLLGEEQLRVSRGPAAPCAPDHCLWACRPRRARLPARALPEDAGAASSRPATKQC